MDKLIGTVALIVAADGKTVRSKWRRRPPSAVLSAEEAVEALRAGDVAIVKQSDARGVKEAMERMLEDA